MCWISVFIYNFYSFFRKLKKGIARWKNPCCGDMLFSYLHLFHCRKTFLVDENVDIINNLFGKNRNRKREREREWKLTPSFPRGSSKLICRRYPKSFKRVITVSGEMRPSISFKWVITVTGEMAPSISYFPLFSPLIN